MTTESRAMLPEQHPIQTESVATAVDAIYNWNYEPEIDQLRTLYANALDRQWIAMRDLDWDADIDQTAFARTFALGGLPITRTAFWQTLSQETQWEVARRSAALMLSTFLHGEQGALITASQLVAAVPHMDGKFYASTQTLDEARHVEVFAAYVRKLDDVHPITPALRKILDAILSAESWKMKAVGMNIVLEGLALYSFRDMRNQTEEPLLRKLLTYVARDEARHTGYGIKYLNAVVPTLPESEKAEIEDFAFEAARQLIDQRTGTSMRTSMLEVWASAGIDPEEAIGSMLKERDLLTRAMRDRGQSMGPVHGFVVPTLNSIGLYSDRIRGHFKDMWSANIGLEMGERMAREDAALPSDLGEWVDAGYETL
jgi:rubrerythrin